MSALEVSEEQRDQMIEGMIKMLGLERKHPSREELEKEMRKREEEARSS